MSAPPASAPAQGSPPGWSLLGVLAGAVGYVLALTPSLVPRTSLTQAIVCALTAMLFYAAGAIVEGTAGALARMVKRRPRTATPRIPSARGGTYWAKVAVAALAALTAALLTQRSVGWQIAQRTNDQAMGDAPISVFVVGIAAILCIVILSIARGLRAAGRAGARLVATITGDRLPFAVRTALGGALAVLCSGAVIALALTACMPLLARANDSTDGQVQPVSADRSGSPQSLIPWQSLGAEGRLFTGDGNDAGPAAGAITDVTGRPALEPIRIYAGMQSADGLQAQADLALADLTRAGGLKRAAIIVYTPAASGYIDPVAASAAEYVLGGDVASVGIQYAMLPSALSMAFGAQDAIAAGKVMLATVREAVDALPQDTRPKVFLYGESLGAFGSVGPLNGTGVQGLLDQADGALWAGPPANTAYWQQLNALTQSGPAWQPVLDGGTVVRFAATPAGIATPPGTWGPVRGLFLQNATDPVTWWNSDLIFSEPAWLQGKRGPGVPAEMTWTPLVTFAQVLVDLPSAGAPPTGSMPPGVGHNYLSTIGAGWIAVLQPPQWTAGNTLKLQAALKNTLPPTPANGP